MISSCIRTQRRKVLVLIMGSLSVIMILIFLSSNPNEERTLSMNYIDSEITVHRNDRDDQDSYWSEDGYKDPRRDTDDEASKTAKETNNVDADAGVDTDSDSEEDDGYYENKPFEMSDFDNASAITLPSLRFEEVKHSNELKNTRHLTHKEDANPSQKKSRNSRIKFLQALRRDYSNVTVRTVKHRIPIVEDKVYWSVEVESVIPRGISDEYAAHFVAKTRRSNVRTMAKPDWTRCGRLQNQFVTMMDGSTMCARYRHPRPIYVQGEVLSFYLARLLDLHNVPIVVLSKVNTTVGPWIHQNLTAAAWQDGTVVALIQWIDNLQSDRSSVRLPPILLRAYESATTLNYKTDSLLKLNLTQLAELAQWTDLILFDYLTGNYDRVASMQDGAEKENNPEIMHERIRNLRKSTKTNSLWMFDNESGLLDAYELLHRGLGPRRFIHFHETMLRAICLFRKSTIAKLRTLASSGDPARDLVRFAERNEPLLGDLPSALSHRQFHDHFQERVEQVLKWFANCGSSRR